MPKIPTRNKKTAQEELDKLRAEYIKGNVDVSEWRIKRYDLSKRISLEKVL